MPSLLLLCLPLGCWLLVPVPRIDVVCCWAGRVGLVSWLAGWLGRKRGGGRGGQETAPTQAAAAAAVGRWGKRLKLAVPLACAADALARGRACVSFSPLCWHWWSCRSLLLLLASLQYGLWPRVCGSLLERQKSWAQLVGWPRAAVGCCCLNKRQARLPARA